jgi:hypothetical protein
MQRIPRSLLLFFLINAFSLYATGNSQALTARARQAISPLASSSILLWQETDEITKANWQQHPKIKAIRAIVQSVNAGISRKTFTVKKRAFEYCGPDEDTARTLATDSKGVVRFYENEGGSEDSALKWEHYYDEGGRLRFVFITGGAVNGSKLEHRIYFDETGKRIWEEQVYKKGPGYTFPEVWPDEQLQLTDAAAKFAAKSQCPETKGASKGKRARSRK